MKLLLILGVFAGILMVICGINKDLIGVIMSGITFLFAVIAAIGLFLYDVLMEIKVKLK
jgi:hypothetical protein